ncbi:MAG: SDR family NAD(P)-dependent oxidoreductase, partial [Bdellovibrionales bacterium]|nr:SDR family NAD(P)-dependent oxidoreductase [Bdellovibrionales bacterium]
MEFKESQAIVTGAGRGIGLELARQLLDRGATVAATIRGEPTAQLAELKQRYPNRLEILPLDVSQDSSAQAFGIKIAASGWTHVDLLINNAGVIGDRIQGLEKTETET